MAWTANKAFAVLAKALPSTRDPGFPTVGAVEDHAWAHETLRRSQHGCVCLGCRPSIGWPMRY